MEQIGIYEARTKFAELIRGVKEAGKEFLITSRGEPVALMTQAYQNFSESSFSEVLRRIKERRRVLEENGPFLKEGETVNSFARDGLKW